MSSLGRPPHPAPARPCDLHRQLQSGSAQGRVSRATADTVEEVRNVIYADLVFPGGNIWDFYLGKARWWILRFCQHEAERAKWLLAGANKASYHYQQSAGKEGLNLWLARFDGQLSEAMIDEGLSSLELLFIVALAACQLQPKLLEARAAVGLPSPPSTTRGLNGKFPSQSPASNADEDDEEQRVGLFEARYRDLC